VKTSPITLKVVMIALTIQTILTKTLHLKIKDDAIKTKGYFIYPSQLFVNVAKTAKYNPILIQN
jgi:hypothetical protein